MARKEPLFAIEESESMLMVGKSAGSPGDVFCVMRGGGAVLGGVILKTNRIGILIAFFYDIGKLNPVVSGRYQPDPEDAILVARVGDHSLRKGSWQLIGRVDIWNEGEWPLPSFYRKDAFTGNAIEVVYDKDDPGKVVRERKASALIEQEGVSDSLLGSVMAENIAIKKLLNSK